MSDDARQFSTKQRKRAASSGAAMPDGSFPIKNQQDLKNAIQAFGRAKNKAKAKAHIIARARALNCMNLLPDGWVKKTDKADGMADLITCPEDGCERAFLTNELLMDHADSVHTYDEIQSKVSQAVRAKFGRPSTPMAPGIYCWVVDLTDTWVVFQTDADGDGVPGLFQADYTIDDSGVVTLGDPKPVERKVVYVPAARAD